jgi:MurNAc alpha-1-phosphate uridylyltransferase
MKAMILAAGLGARMRPLTDHTPKPLLTALGKPLIAYHLEKLAAVGIKEVVINHAYLGEQIEQFVGDGARWGVKVCFSREMEPLETGGGICQALPLLGNDPFLVINADVWLDYSLSELVNHSFPGLAHLVLVPNPQHNPQGDFVLNKDGWIDQQDTSSEHYTFSGLSILRPQLFAGKLPGKFPLAPILKEAIIKQQVTGELFDGYWLDVGTVQRLHDLEGHLKNTQ